MTPPSSTLSKSRSAAYEASRLVKGSRGAFFGIVGYSSKGSAQFIQVFDSAELPADGAVPDMVFAVGATSSFSLDLGSLGWPMSNGIVVVNSSTGPTKTIGSADCFFSVRFT